MGSNRIVGRWGEEAAAGYLAGHGYEVVARNVRTPYGEIDLVTMQDGLTVLVEVKSRTSRSLGPPEISVTGRKQQHMLRSAAYYAQAQGIAHWRIDVISILRTGSGVEITHFENAVAQADET